MITVLIEAEGFYSAIHSINVLAFGRENEASLVERLRESSDFIPKFSLVALKEGRVVGHIV
jgi:predicted N-acetyltransferase YhbS